MSLIDQWGWISIDEIGSSNFKKYIHTDFQQIANNSKLSDYTFKCLKVYDGDFYLCQSSEISLAIHSVAFRVMPKQPKYIPNQKVKYKTSKDIIEDAIIHSIDWHNNFNKHIYTLKANNKLKTKWYYEEDIIS